MEPEIEIVTAPGPRAYAAMIDEYQASDWITPWYVEASRLIHEIFRRGEGWPDPVHVAMSHELDRLRAYLSHPRSARLDDLIDELDEQWEIIRAKS